MKTYYWHIHHEVIAEPTEDIGKRKEYVRINKPKGEVETRLRLMVPVKDQDSVDKAYKKYIAIKVKAWEDYDAIKDKAREEYNAKLELLHKKEHPDCPWNGKTIFPE